MKKIKLAVIALEESYLERLANRLRGANDQAAAGYSPL
jgi:hypothetical protein